jgi:hypothetical protein
MKIRGNQIVIRMICSYIIANIICAIIRWARRTWRFTMFGWIDSQYHLGTNKLTQGKWLSGDHPLLAESGVDPIWWCRTGSNIIHPAASVNRMSILPQSPRVDSGKSLSRTVGNIGVGSLECYWSLFTPRDELTRGLEHTTPNDRV